VVTSGPPLMLKLKPRPRYTGDSVSLQIFRSPYLPPAGWLVNVTIVSLAAVEPGWTKTIACRRFKSVNTNRLLGLVVTLTTSDGGSLGSSVMRTAPASVVIGPEQRPPLTVMAAPPLIENWNVLPVMPLVEALQISTLPVPGLQPV